MKKVIALGALLALSAPAFADQTPSQLQFTNSLASNLSSALGQIDMQRDKITELTTENTKLKEQLAQMGKPAGSEDAAPSTEPQGNGAHASRFAPPPAKSL